MGLAPPKRREFSLRSLLEGLALLWAILILANFLWREPPFRRVCVLFVRALLGGRIALYLDGHLLGMMIRSMVFFALAAVPGWFYVRRRTAGAPRWLAPVLAISFGWGFWMLAAELFAIFHLLHRWSLALSWLLVTLLCRRLPGRREPGAERSPRWREQSGFEKGVWIFALFLLVFITYWTFYHALVFPVTYWDSLILYVDYGEQTYLAHGFPTRVCAQVGLGLGANYPHFFPLTGASMATLWGSWKDSDAQFISPFAVLLATFLIYHLALRLTGKPWLAMLTALLFRSVPYATIYAIYATDYAVAVFLTTLFLWGLQGYLEEKRFAGLEAAALAVAVGMHLNYLMGILWLPLLAAPWLQARPDDGSWSLRRLYPRRVLLLFLVAALLGSVWYVRNIVVTGNPVYAFFPRLFGGKNINLDVLESCFEEWRRHGDGLGRFGPTLGAKLRALPDFLFFQPNYHWKYGPVLSGFALPGIFFALRRGKRTLAAALIVFVAVWGYHLLLGDLYLYHTLMVVPAVALLGLGWLDALRNAALKRAWAGVALLVGCLVGASAAVVGGKAMLFGPLAIELPQRVRKTQGDQWPQALKEQFLALTLRDSWPMWQYLNARLGPTRILTHENRHHYIRRDIELIGLDDCRLIDGYDRPFSEVAERLEQLGVEYYLEVPFEAHHPIVSRLGIRDNLEGYFELVHTAGQERLYRFRPPADSPPRNKRAPSG